MFTDKKFSKIGVMIDCSRNAVVSLSAIKKLIPILSDFGYNSLQLYTEDTLKAQNEEYLGYLRGAFTSEQIKEIVDYACAYDIEVVPCIQTLAHMNCMLKLPVYEEFKDIDDIMVADDEKVYAFLENVISSARKNFKSKRINIGMDEAAHIGMGRYLARHGYVNKKQIIVEHLKRVAKICDKYGFIPMIWSDMLFDIGENGLQYVIPKDIEKWGVPENVRLIYWDYYSKDKQHYIDRLEAHKKLNREMGFAAGAWTWTGFVPNNQHSLDTAGTALDVLYGSGVDEAYMTIWGDNGAECPFFASLPALCYFGLRANGVHDIKVIKQKFLEITGMAFDDFMLLDKANDVGKNKVDLQNPTKYMLYNDVFLGKLDCTVEDGDARDFKRIAGKLKKFVNHGEYGYMFNMEYKLCRALEVKCDLGIKTRLAYGDRQKVKELIPTYKLCIKRIKEFRDAFADCWAVDKKPFGFEVHEIRLSGLIGRITACMQKLIDYADGKIDRIEELEEQLLNYEGGGKEFSKTKIVFNNYLDNVTNSVM